MPLELIILAAGCLLFSAFVIHFKVPAFAVIFSLFVGQVLSKQASQDAYGFFAGVSGLATYEYVQLALLLLPVVLTMVFLKGRGKKLKLVYEILPAILAGILLLVLLYDYVPFVKNAVDMATNDLFQTYSSAVVVASAVIGLVSVWLSVPKPSDKHGKH